MLRVYLPFLDRDGNYVRWSQYVDVEEHSASLNWFEATQLSASSGAFSDYLQGVRAVAEPEPRRRDPISVYLDSIESQME